MHAVDLGHMPNPSYVQIPIVLLDCVVLLPMYVNLVWPLMEKWFYHCNMVTRVNSLDWGNKKLFEILQQDPKNDFCHCNALEVGHQELHLKTQWPCVDLSISRSLPKKTTA